MADLGEVRRRENQEFSLDLSEPGSPPAFPFPSFSWSRDGQSLSNATATRQYGYPSIFIGSVQPSDAGNYTLSAMNYASDETTPVGSDVGSFTLNVLCKFSWGHLVCACVYVCDREGEREGGRK